MFATIFTTIKKAKAIKITRFVKQHNYGSSINIQMEHCQWDMLSTLTCIILPLNFA